MSDVFHLNLTKAQLKGATLAIVPGDPARSERIAKKLDNPEFLASTREYTSWLGYLNGQPVVVCSTGIGGPSTSICVEELAQLGVRTFLRIGTTGAIQPHINVGDILITTGAVRLDGASRHFAPIEYPAVANLDVTNALVEAAKEKGFIYHTGVVQSKDSFYGQHEPEAMPAGYELINKWEAWKRMGCLASEMESAALFIVAGKLRARMGSCLLVLANQEREKLGLENPVVHDTDMAIRVAVEAIRRMIKEDQGQVL